MTRVADYWERLDVPAFLAIIWYSCRNRGTLRFSALIRTIVTEATIYFFAIVAMQIYVQLSLNLMEVESLSWFPLFCDY